MNILGISCFYHDAAAALLQDGKIIAAIAEERLSRKKHDNEFPRLATLFCLKQAGISSGDLDYVVFYEKPFVKFERIWMTILKMFPKTLNLFHQSMSQWLTRKLWIKEILRKEIGISSEKILFSEHHLSHASSAFYCSGFEEAAILTVDGVGEWTTASWGVGDKNGIRLLEEMQFPHSVGLLYSAFTAFLGFEVNEGEYKVMGMAPYGVPRYEEDVHHLLEIFEDGSLWLNMNYFTHHTSTSRAYGDKFVEIFGPPREPSLPFFTLSTGWPSYFGEKPSDVQAIGEKNQHYADIAASIQKVTEEILLKMVKHLHRRTGGKNLCMAGGVALNSVANGRILREGPFEKIYIQPAAGDDGGALGAALYAWHGLLKKPHNSVMNHAYWGQAYDAGEIERTLRDQSISYETCASEDALMERMVDALSSGKVIGFYQGRSEWGPRALGNRSILADPRRADMKDIVNTKIKFREPYRPFAPSVIEEETEKFFDLSNASQQTPARFMLYVCDVRKGKQSALPAITHVDGTARLQTVQRETNPRYHRLISSFGKATGVPVVLNTSFNLKGEPIVDSPRDALSTFHRSGLDMLVLENMIIRK